jgi:cation:H+ antiporter
MSPGFSPVVLAQIAAGLALLYVGGELLVRGASGLALRLGMSPLAIGLTIVAFGTSMPELVVSVDAALSGSDAIAVGNVVGSNIANVALILGLVVLLRPTIVEAKVVRFDAPLMIVASLLMIGGLANGRLSRVEGALLLAGLVGYTAFTFWEARRESPAVREEFAAMAPGILHPIAWGALVVAAGLAVLVAGGHLLVGGAVSLAAAGGVSEATIGLTIVAIGASLPELATSLVAALKRQGDIAVGNIVGSNLFNILGILGVTAVIHPLARGDIDGVDLAVMLGVAVALLGLLTNRLALERAEGGLLLATYTGYLVWLFA